MVFFFFQNADSLTQINLFPHFLRQGLNTYREADKLWMAHGDGSVECISVLYSDMHNLHVCDMENSSCWSEIVHCSSCSTCGNPAPPRRAELHVLGVRCISIFNQLNTKSAIYQNMFFFFFRRAVTYYHFYPGLIHIDQFCSDRWMESQPPATEPRGFQGIR